MNVGRDVPEVVDKLQVLGSAERIADFFAAEGVTGVRGRVFACPIATYLHRETRRRRMASVTCHWVHAEGDEDSNIRIWDTPVGEFVANFDAGDYPQLEKEGS